MTNSTLKKIALTNEKGNIASKVRTNVTDQVEVLMKANLPNVIDSPKGLALAVGIDFLTGATIYAIIQPVLTMTLEVKEKVAKDKAPVAATVVPNIFE